jgi:hypothetical protein
MSTVTNGPVQPLAFSPEAVFEEFVAFSSDVTGFSEYRILGTGQANEFFDTVGRILGDALRAEFFEAIHAVRVQAAGNTSRLEQLFRAKIFGDEKYGPIARNLIKLWYVGTWYRLPDPWHGLFQATGEEDQDQIVSTSAYTEALLWPAIGANPPGAKGPGFGTWAEPPRIPEY